MFYFWAFTGLSIERFLYGWIYHFPDSFKAACGKSPLSDVLQWAEGKYWDVAKRLGVYIKVFQFGIIGWDVLIRHGLRLSSQPVLIVVGLVLVAIGQVLNAAVFNAIGAIGVYYGGQLGYEVPWCTCFPYNTGISDPQYWGVILFIWGVYIVMAPTANILDSYYFIPWVETFWYVTSMKLLESSDNGTAVLQLLGLKKAKEGK
mmetsp:Transcript_26956/g.46806  ORF Transcript_26956/g.46806 Transcript_26956/m.46806 type:complete len:203 (+) Transcript_26956:70-678(+)